MQLFNMKVINRLFFLHKEILAGRAERKRLADKFNNNIRTVGRYLSFLRDMGAPIYFLKYTNAYVYRGEFDLTEEIRKRYKLKIEVE